MDPLTPLGLAAILLVGMALALSQFCMVRSVLGVREGSYAPARCVLAIALSLQLLVLLRGGETQPSYAPAAPVLLGGLLSVVAARANGGCYIGTFNELCRGQWRRLYTVAGWVFGLALLRVRPLQAHAQRSWEVGLVIAALTALLLWLGWLARRRRQAFCPNPAIGGLQGLRAWSLMLATGVLMGFLHHTSRPWHPSTLARERGRALAAPPLPPASACGLLVPLGMLIVHRWRGQLSSQAPVSADLSLLLWGTLMGLGTVWGMGANDGYLFRSLPVGSLHAAAGLAAMTYGILLPLDWRPRGASR